MVIIKAESKRFTVIAEIFNPMALFAFLLEVIH